ncbi:uncharacterized protein MONOS_18016 [Monocercomonoides exilis]|uniref:uncharacterized protein n=1 Tax=Monocercomonoides exilis TaxID=2049356 RepID=UPI003559671D|nr:hypothetical protein MONOS_18016 [Monocercomonoides exilis]
MSTKEKTETCNTKKFTELFSQLSYSSDDEQREKIEEMNEVMGKMNKEEFMSVFTKDLSNRMKEMTDEKILSMENAILLLKHVGYCQTLKCFYDFAFKDSFLSDRFQEMIIEEKMMKEEKDEKLLVDLCECYLLLNRWPSSEMSSIIVPCLLKVALKREESEESQKEVEMALLALSNFWSDKVPKELWINEFKEIFQYHKEHHNLTRIAYQSAWKFFLSRTHFDHSLEHVIVNEVHFEREAIRELEELAKWMNWKKKEEEMSKKESKEVLIIGRWLCALGIFFRLFRFWKEEFAELIGSVANVCRTARENYKEISNWCIFVFEAAAGSRDATIEDLLESGAIDAIFEEIHKPTMDDRITNKILNFFMSISRKAKEKKRDEMEEVKRKEAKRKVFEMMEEEGIEDDVIGRYCNIIEGARYFEPLSKCLEDYFAYC